MAYQYIYTMKDLKKVYPPNKEVLKGIWLSFFPGAKIGLLGVNGSGKSTILRIMAGIDGEFMGEADPAAGIKVGYLPQEPRLDSTKDVLGNVMEGVAETRALLDRFESINARLGEDISPDEMEKLLEEQSSVQDAIEAAKGWELDRTLEIAMEALRCPPPDAEISDPLRRRDPPRRPLPAALEAARPAPPRRADEPPRRRVGGLARASPRAVSGHGRRLHPRPLLPRQRRGMDPRAGSRVRHPLGGELLLVARPEAEAARDRGEAGDRAPAHARA